MDDQDWPLDEFVAESRRLQTEVDRYRSGFRHKLDCWPPRPEQLTESEEIVDRLGYYWFAALINSGDVFGYVNYIIENRSFFVAIGALGTLRALDGLLPFYQQQQSLPTGEAKDDYWRRTREERKSFESRAEGVIEFGRLLLAYAQQNLPDPGG